MNVSDLPTAQCIDAPSGAGAADKIPGVRSSVLAQGAPPVFLEPDDEKLLKWDEFIAWFEANLTALGALLDEVGAVVLRGFPVKTAEQFSDVAGLLGVYEQGYAGGASLRSAVTKNTMEATRYSEFIKIPLHQEMAYLPTGPGRLVFFCLKSAMQGGETPIGDMRAFTNRLNPELRDKLERHGVIGYRNFAAPSKDGVEEGSDDHPDMRSWQTAFYTKDREEVERVCAAQNVIPIWHEDGSLTVKSEIPPFATHPRTGEAVYRNVIHVRSQEQFGAKLPPERRARIEEMARAQKFRSGYYLGDGSRLSDAEFEELTGAFDALEVAWPWQEGDMMLLDNLLVAHGRNPYSGPREIQVALLQ